LGLSPGSSWSEGAVCVHWLVRFSRCGW